MFRLLLCLVAVLLFTVQPVLAEDAKGNDFAPYGVLVGLSPFGGGLNFAYNESRKTTWNFGLGGTFFLKPEMTDKISGNEYDIESQSSWVGCFLNHRPFETAEWFRLVAGIGIGSIENTVTSQQELADGTTNTLVYEVDYNENPVGYLGIGFGAEAKYGFIWGVDLGLLQTSGPEVRQVAGDASLSGANFEERRDELLSYWLFGKTLLNMQVTVGYGF